MQVTTGRKSGDTQTDSIILQRDSIIEPTFGKLVSLDPLFKLFSHSTVWMVGSKWYILRYSDNCVDNLFGHYIHCASNINTAGCVARSPCINTVATNGLETTNSTCLHIPLIVCMLGVRCLLWYGVSREKNWSLRVPDCVCVWFMVPGRESSQPGDPTGDFSDLRRSVLKVVP